MANPQDVKEKARDAGTKVGEKVGEYAAAGVQKAQDLAGKAQGAAHDVANKAQNFAGDLAGRAQNVAGNVADQARHLAGQAGEKAGEYAGQARDAAEGYLSAGGERLSGFADTVRKTGQGTQFSGVTNRVAEGLESTGEYLQQHGFSDMGQDLAGVVRRYPIQSLLVGFGVGFLLASATSRRS